MVTEVLFEGRPAPYGGWSNQRELTNSCPPEFRNSENPWVQLVMQVSSLGADTSDWRWKAEEGTGRRKQFKSFFGVFYSRILTQEHKLAVGAWMLSTMLEELPVHKPKPKSAPASI